MRTCAGKSFITVLCAAMLAINALAKPRAETAALEVAFSISSGQSGPFVKQLPIKSHGRIVLDVTSAPKGVELTITLRRPDGSVAGDISGRGGNLSLTYFATEREVNAKGAQWSISISRTSGREAVSGKLKASYPS